MKMKTLADMVQDLHPEALAELDKIFAKIVKEEINREVIEKIMVHDKNKTTE